MKLLFGSLRYRILAFTALLMSVAVFILIFSTYSKLKKDIITKNQEAFTIFGRIFESQQETMIKEYSLGLDSLLDNRTLVQTFAARDRDGLAKLVDNLYDTRLKHLYGVDQFHFHIPPAVSFYRVHSKENYGDNLEKLRKTVVKAMTLKSMVAGIEAGRGGLGLRVVKPVWYNFDMVGTVEFGGRIEHILRATKASTDIEYATAVYNPIVEKARGLVDVTEWMPYGKLTVYDFSSEATRKNISSGLMEKSGIIRMGDKYYMTSKMPLYDFSSEQIGYLFLLKDTTREVRQMHSEVTKQAGIIIAYGLFAIALVSGYMIKVLFRPIEKIARHVSEKEITLETPPVPLKYNDNSEITVLSDAYNNLSLKLFSNLQELSKQIHAVEDVNKNLETAIGTRTRQLEEANAQLESALDNYRYINDVKTEFLTSVSHEIRTPMNAIIGLSYLALQTGLNSKQYEYISKINSSATLLMEIINDILDYSKIEAGKLELESISFNLYELLKNVKDILEVQAERKKIYFSLGVAPDVPVYVKGDPVRLTQVLSNLGSNAVKFTDEGYVSIFVENIEADMAYSTLKFTVRDTGIGIPPEKISKIFSSYEQISQKNARKYGGSGLGLSICKKILDKMNGSIKVESVLGQGSSFTVTIRVKNTDVTSAEDLGERTGVLKGKRVLVAEKSPREQGSISSIYRELMADVVPADSHIALMQVLGNNIEEDGTCGFDLIVIENWVHDLPSLSAFESLNTDLSAMPPVIYISNELPPETVLNITTLAKPASPTLLLNTAVTIITGNEAEAEPEETACGSVAGQQIKALVADDNGLNREVAKEFLMLLGVETKFAENGSEALTIARKEPFDIIFMDIMMPELDGYAASRLIREDGANADTPIYAMTASVMDEDRLRIKTSLLNGFISKPLKINELSKAVTEALRIRASRGTGFYMHDSTGHVDFITGLSLFGGNEEIYKRALKEFLPAAAALRTSLAESSEPDELKRIVLSADSYAENLALNQVAEAVKNTLKSLEDEDTAAVRTAVNELSEQLTKAEEIIAHNLKTA